MTIKTRHEERLELFAVFLDELLAMPQHAYRTLAEWSLSVGILALIFEGQVGGTVGVMGVTLLMSVDFARLYSIYKKVELGEADDLTNTE
jgi:hypothetical protein